MAFSKMGFGVGECGKAAFSHPDFLFAPALGRGLGGGEKQGFLKVESPVSEKTLT